MSGQTSISTAFERTRRYQELSRAFRRATEHDPTLTPECSPYETQYGSPHVFAQSAELADIAAFYRACGLAAPQKERVDHLSVELEFLSFLTFKEAYAIHGGDDNGACCVREVQKKFLMEHLARWVPAFSHRFESRDPELASKLREWVKLELAMLGAEPAQLRAVDLRPAGEAEETFECGGGTCDFA